RLAQGEADLVWAGSWIGIKGKRVAVQLSTLECRQADDLPGARRLPSCFGDRLADFRADGPRNFAGTLVRELRRSEQDLHPRVGRSVTPPYGSRLRWRQR